MADKDLERIIEDLRRQRQLIERLNDSTLTEDERRALRVAIERLRDPYRKKAPN